MVNGLIKKIWYRVVDNSSKPPISAFKPYWSVGKVQFALEESKIEFTHKPLLGQGSDFFDLNVNNDITFTDYFICDPFIINFEGVLYMFFEICGFINQKYTVAICSSVLKEDLSSVSNISVLKYADDMPGINRTFTVSYPHPIIIMNKLYIILEEFHYKPETCIYEFDPLTNSLELVTTLPIRMFDPNIQFQDGQIWVYGIDESYTIRVFLSENICGPFAEHKNSGIYSGKDFARNAGMVFVWNNKLIRPYQNCRLTYGEKIGFSEIEISVSDGFKIVDNPWLDGVQIKGGPSLPFWARNKVHHIAVHNVTGSSVLGLVDGARNKYINLHAWDKY